MKNYSLVLKIIFSLAIGLLVGRFFTPLFGLESRWASIALSTGVTITLLIIIESITDKLINGKTNIITMAKIKSLHQVKKSEIGKAAFILADAFTEDPLFKALFGDTVKNSYKYSMVAEFMLRYCHKYGAVYASSEELEGIMAITQDQYTYMTLWQMIRSCTILPFFRIGIKSISTVARALGSVDVARKKHMKDRSFAYLQIIGVAAENQGKGDGGRLLKELIAMADEAKLPIYLGTETESNVRWYERFGFRTLEQMNLPVINLPLWAMIREIKDDEVHK